jgi:hypothetical protein
MERDEECVPLAVDLLPVPFDERVSEKSAVRLKYLRVSAIAEALEERGGASMSVKRKVTVPIGRLAI